MDTMSYLLGKKSGGGSTPNLQDKEVEITTNGETTITADSGYDGLGNVEVTTNVPSQKYAPRRITFMNYTGTELNNEVENLDISNITDMSNFFNQCNNLEILNISNWNTSNVTTMANMFNVNRSMISLDLKEFRTTSLTSANYMFNSCISLQHLDIRNMDLSNSFTSTAMFGTGTNIVPANCEIIVKNNTCKQWMNTNFNWLTNVKTVAEYEASL